MKLNIAVVQLNPILGQLEKNYKTALKLAELGIERAKNKKLDLIVFPEMAITGYNFKSKLHVEPFLEIAGTGKTYELAKSLSEKYKCHTLIGYPEKFPISETAYKIYNSAMLIDAKGKIVHNYRKTFLYETDEVWGCDESPEGFQAFDMEIQGRKLKATIGICMDLNPYKFEADFNDFEFGTFCAKEKVDLVLAPMAWMNTSWSADWSEKDVAEFTEIYQQPLEFEVNVDESQSQHSTATQPFDRKAIDEKTKSYWRLRLYPIFAAREEKRNVLVVYCNRSGVEDNLMYAGTSNIVRFGGGLPIFRDESVVLDYEEYGELGQGTEGVLVREGII
ncbi:hypothetical protein CANARDRAFT_9286 [[Candida] arabinofermentans NRRL YB-2248]|uniref:CN hydrolase domain-containing protein n=1 Tax=[Candida] arabinofermentans NRRL YB-2248 TaxID=983967 RepID=A0A1E4SW45_9ASCO|nr:hypothetical protein CANARDRAFT_9286 [[Candida] arabinofermentans NRRL YB-2248]